jgi:hypothetical protein
MTVHRPPLHPPPQHPGGPLPLLGREPRSLRRAWFAATTVGEALGFLAPALVAVVAFDRSPALALAAMVLAGAVEGAVLGSAQALVLRRELLGFSPRTWVAATAAGTAGAWTVAMAVVGSFTVWQDWSLAVILPGGVLLVAALLSSIGLAQWLVLREHVSRSSSWVAVNAAAWAAGLGGMLLVTTPLWHEGQGTVPALAIGAVGGLVMALVVAAATAVWLTRLLRPGRDASLPPAGLPAAQWETLAVPTDRFVVFEARQVDELPVPVQRWLVHAIAPGTTLLTGVETEGVGHVRIGSSWRRLTFRQRSSLDGGFVWAAHTRLGGLPVTGFDRYTDGEGELSWRLLGRVRVVSGSGEEVSRSAAGRHAAELLATVPAVALDPAARWSGIDTSRATAAIVVGEEEQRVTITVDARGRLRQVELDRWGTPPGQSYGRYRFGAMLTDERMFDGYRVPTRVDAGWHIGTPRWEQGTFLRYRLRRCSFR